MMLEAQMMRRSWLSDREELVVLMDTVENQDFLEMGKICSVINGSPTVKG
jgi:hypothetical protein